MQDLNDKIKGNELTANEWNEVPSEIQNVIEASGQTLTSSDLTQLRKASNMVIDTFASLRGLAVGMGLVTVKGKATDADGLGGIFYWDAASIAVDDDKNTLKLTAVTTGRYIRSYFDNGIGAGDIALGAATGTADAITATLGLTALTDGTVVFLKAKLANTITTPTFDPDGLGGKKIVKNGSQALFAGDIARVDHELILRYNATNTEWELLNPNSVDINSKAAITAISSSDELIVYDVSEGGNKKVTVGNISGAMTLIQTQNASSVASVDFTSGIDATYDEYVIIFSGVRPVTDGDNFRFRVSVAGSFITGAAYGDAVSSINESSTVNDNGSTGNNYIRLDGTIAGAGNATFKGVSGEIRIFKPANAAFHTNVSWFTSLINSTGALYSCKGGGRHQAASAVDGFRFFFNSSNITEGSFSLYGVAK